MALYCNFDNGMEHLKLSFCILFHKKDMGKKQNNNVLLKNGNQNIPLKAVLGGMRIVALSISSHEQAQ